MMEGKKGEDPVRSKVWKRELGGEKWGDWEDKSLRQLCNEIYFDGAMIQLSSRGFKRMDCTESSLCSLETALLHPNVIISKCFW